MIDKTHTNYCLWHTTGKPLWWTGQFFVKDCRACEDKAEKDPSIREAPSCEQAFELHKARKRESGQKAGARIRKARAAMTKQWHESVPGREIT